MGVALNTTVVLTEGVRVSRKGVETRLNLAEVAAIVGFAVKRKGMEPAGAVEVDVVFSRCGFPVVVERAGVVETGNVTRTVLCVGDDGTVSMTGVALGGEVEAGRRNGTEPRLAGDVVDTAEATVLDGVVCVGVAVGVGVGVV